MPSFPRYPRARRPAYLGKRIGTMQYLAFPFAFHRLKISQSSNICLTDQLGDFHSPMRVGIVFQLQYIAIVESLQIKNGSGDVPN